MGRAHFPVLLVVTELDRFFPFGPDYQDSQASFYDRDDGCIEVRLPQPFQFGCTAYDSIFVSDHTSEFLQLSRGISLFTDTLSKTDSFRDIYHVLQ